ncbi:hypothetical protein UFOVP625_38 [uncultured Caudovirales phage]|jgi:hypothetical protein|uniref:Holin n=1 Tax=uncultured Caudovirales phage TaxID=2100421 RepID=A0A6J5N6B6_9CAUD|nr:hypothetical protein UFOVP625_38 [uncultured Caudovirales phage]
MKQTALRVFAVFGYSAMAIIGGASVLGDIPVWKAALLAGIASTAQVLEKLARAYADDGKISKAELNDAFGVTKGE